MNGQTGRKLYASS